MDSKSNTLQVWNNIAAAYQDKFMDLDLYDDSYDALIRLIEKRNPSIFEIGCGPGNITRYLLKRRPDFQITGIDLAPNMVKLAAENNPTARFEVMDCRAIGSLNDRYHAIVCGFCLPYLSKEETAKLMKDSAALLNTGGLFYCSAIEDDYEKSGLETSSDGQHTMYIYCHQADFLIASLNESGFEIAHEFRKVYPKSDSTTATHLILIARKNG
ncbi:MAG: class I SAM-dependent methyltransferase [Saprospiraceae bacterium]|nr:class I SAM-dependent methyltransferase [Saprospiraceae bacterium]MCF8250466.1 class I SAM-dependent methyltransferase [Saprospiraceae bacterium]MCF8282756.1 class I SAM-dependent methyltransferase [Bacteroidales bacterium]MCF8312388.1 class I SAM-dependent methyltransferase [Saprospiraceae bacterium]MCF8440615.1 class I SAM-dependent methyltransferase [Saprospiraceae bacterium]